MSAHYFFSWSDNILPSSWNVDILFSTDPHACLELKSTFICLISSRIDRKRNICPVALKPCRKIIASQKLRLEACPHNYADGNTVLP